MFRIEYTIIHCQFIGIEKMSDEEIRSYFLLGNVLLTSSDAKIEMEWEWIPLLDFAYCLKQIGSRLRDDDPAKDLFEFTENAETLKFFKHMEQVRIEASFSSRIIETTLGEFEKAVKDLHSGISEYIRKCISSEPPIVLQKYLSI